MLGGVLRTRLHAFLLCFFRFVGVPVGRSGPLGSLSSWSLALSRFFFSLFLLPSLCLSSLPQHHTVIEESNQIQHSSISLSGSMLLFYYVTPLMQIELVQRALHYQTFV